MPPIALEGRVENSPWMERSGILGRRVLQIRPSWRDGANQPRDLRAFQAISMRSITPDTALRLARFFQNSPEFWLNLQQMHDLTKAKIALAKTIEAEVPVYEPSAA